MRNIVRTFLAVLTGFFVFVGLIYWSTWVGYGTIRSFIPIGLQSAITGAGYPQSSVFYLKDHDIYTSLGFLVLCVAGGLTAALFVWKGSIPKKTSLVLTIISFLVLLPLSAANYAGGDAFSTRSVQAVLNVPMVFLGVLVTLFIYDIELDSRTARVLQLFSAAFVIMQGILIPLLYSTLWWLNFQNAISLAATKDLTPGWISTVSGLAGLGFGLFKYLKDGRESSVLPARKLWMPGDKET